MGGSAPFPLCEEGLVVVTGPRGAGKTSFAEALVGDMQGVMYLATALSGSVDPDLKSRIVRHRAARRPAVRVGVVADPDDVVGMAASWPGPLLVDSVALWLAAYHPSFSRAPVGALVGVLSSRKALTVAVTEEAHVGSADPEATSYFSALSSLNRSLSDAARLLYVVVSGRPVIVPSRCQLPAMA